MQRSGTEAIRTQPQPSKPKREITNITKSQNTKGTYGQLSEKLFSQKAATHQPKPTKNVTETRTPKTGNREPQQNHRLGMMNYWGA